ncbi:16S rRNA (uracil(1498)-N(3))-methyltransferase [Niveibacterium microcysteis]|uniref:Ribosomal RNA small subunit methyltransferase E n=1 Tax=Niveibacterium microcysteis TaxID=2811415 RepID=A0ABX7MDL3_9RHOO|nr:16S rRNA (uracil(1498)-N(3))-methyltransferase [Niveibacterium microcysteis]QSI77822.1 16S rRNA (uracil(1498)-N(3))-methyltransferase [Niveibacterium microcysteis]
MHARFFCPDLPAAGHEFTLPPEVAHHADRVLRLRAGTRVTLFDGAGHEAEAVLLQLGRDPLARIESVVALNREAPLTVTLVQALATGDKMDWIVQKAVELGFATVQPVAAERSVLKLDGARAEKRVEHWRQVAVSACEQSGRNRVMPVDGLLTLPQWLAQPFAGERWVLSPEGGERLSALPAPTTPVALMIGPEGGWSERELAAARAAGCKPLALGPRILRTETAGIAAMAAMLALWGDF